MASYEIYQDMATRTGGDVYIGVVGPVRTRGARRRHPEVLGEEFVDVQNPR